MESVKKNKKQMMGNSNTIVIMNNVWLLHESSSLCYLKEAGKEFLNLTQIQEPDFVKQ